MSDNLQMNLGQGGDKAATDEVTYSGDQAHVQLIRIVDVTGTEGSKTVTPRLGLTDSELRAAPVSVTGSFFPGTQPVSFTWAGLTDAQLRASAVPVSLGSTTVTGTVATSQSGNWNFRTQDGAGNAIGSISDGAGLTSLTMAMGATNFVASAVNSSIAQLANGATFTGAVETIFNQQAISVLLTSDQAGTLTLNQYIDLAGTRRISQWTFSVAANVPFSRCFVGNGNFFNLTFQNTGGSTTTTLNINTAYGTLPAASNLGNMPVGVNEINGSALALGQAGMSSSLPVVLASNQSAVPIVEVATLLTGQATQTATVSNILEAVAGAAGTDVSNVRAASVQVVSTGTAGTFIFEQSNDNTNWIALPVFNAALATAVPIIAAITATASQIIYTFPIRCRFVRLRIATTITGGSIQAFSRLSSDPWTPAVNSIAQATAGNLNVNASGTVTANIGTGSLAGGTNAIGDVGHQYRANATGAASFVSVMSPVTPAATVCKASAGRLLGFQLQNSSAAIRSVKFWNTAQGTVTLGTTAALFEVDVPAGGRAEFALEGGIGFATAITYAVTGAKGLTDNTGALAANDVSGCLVFA